MIEIQVILFFFVFFSQKINVSYVLLSLKIKKNYWIIICLITILTKIGFFINYFSRIINFFWKNCVRCNKFLTTQKKKAVHDILEHYGQGKNVPFEERPLYILRYSGLTIYSIEFKKYNNFYNFYNSEKWIFEKC